MRIISSQATHRSNTRWLALVVAVAVAAAVLFSMKAASPARHTSSSAQVAKPADQKSATSNAGAAVPATAVPATTTPDSTAPHDANADEDTLPLQLD